MELNKLYTYEVQHFESKKRNAKIDTIETWFTLKMDSIWDQGSRVIWTFDNQSLLGFEEVFEFIPEFNSKMRTKLEKWRQVRLQIITDKGGRRLEIANQDELKELTGMMFYMSHAMAEIVKKDITRKKEIEAAITRHPKYSVFDRIEHEIPLFHDIYLDTLLTENIPITVQGEWIPHQVTLDNKLSGKYTVSKTVEFPKEAENNYLNNHLKRFHLDPSTKKEELAKSKYTWENNQTYQFQGEIGIPIKIISAERYQFTSYQKDEYRNIFTQFTLVK